MAVEIQTQRRLYTTPVSIPTAPLEEKKLLDVLAGNTGTPDDLLTGNTSKSNRYPIVHNFEHDMESIFWLLLWTILVRFPCNLDSKEERAEFAGVLSEIFQDTSICSSMRESVFSQDTTLNDILAKFLAPELKHLRASLDGLRNVLLAGHMDRRYNFVDFSSYSTLYKFLRATLSAFQRLAQKEPLPDLLPCRSLYLNSGAAQAEIVSLPLQVNKRPLHESDDGDEYRPVSTKIARSQGSTDVHCGSAFESGGT